MLRFWELSPSPNNTKVRMALRYKKIDFEAVPVDPFKRQPVLDVSGQELTPVVEDLWSVTGSPLCQPWRWK